MCTVKELKEFLNAFPEEASVEVLQGYSFPSYNDYDERCYEWALLSLHLDSPMFDYNVVGKRLRLGNE